MSRKQAVIEFKNEETGEIYFKRKLLPTQTEFWHSKERYVLYSGGYGCGKTSILILKTLWDCMSQDNNYFLLGRRTYIEIHDVLLKDFFDICHPDWIVKYKKTPHPSVIVKTFSGGTSEIIFRNLDKISEKEIAGLNLGGFGIDQAEDIPEGIFIALKGRLRRKNIEHHGYLSANPALSWLFPYFIDGGKKDHKLFEASTLENEVNLPAGYIEDLKTYPPLLYAQFVHPAKWNDTLFAENAVFQPEYLQELSKRLKDPREVREGLQIYKKYQKGHRYQMGIDCAEGADLIDERHKDTRKDNAVITIYDQTEEEEVAKWAGKLEPSATADKAYLFAGWYGNPLMVPEMNSMGVAFVNRVQELGYTNIYRRYEYDKAYNKRLPRVGFRTLMQTKRLLIERFNKKLRFGYAKQGKMPHIYSKDTYAEMKHFVNTPVAGKLGAGAQEGFHDDKVMSLLLSSFEDRDPVPTGYPSAKNRDTISGIEGVNIVPSLEITPDGKWRPPKMFREESVARWTTL